MNLTPDFSPAIRLDEHETLRTDNPASHSCHHAVSKFIAEDFRVKSAAALDGKVQCFAHTSEWVTASTGPCESFTSPPKVALGERFTANGDERQIGVIVATQAEEDMHENGLDIRKGEWTCVAAETLENIPSDENQSQNLTWLFIPRCQTEL